ncbi:MAG: T9SS type A sorting domain-containing protein, partial [Bacteroidota bacterium]
TFSEYIRFEVQEEPGDVVRLQLFDALGRLVLGDEFTAPAFEIQRSGLPQGLYFYRLAVDGKWEASGKILTK